MLTCYKCMCACIFLPVAAPILFSFRLPVCNARPIDIYIYYLLFFQLCVNSSLHDSAIIRIIF